MINTEIKISKVLDNSEKSRITEYVLRQLPEWFGIEESLMEYVKGAKATDFYAAYDSDNLVGFISIKTNNVHTSEIYIIGILKDYHGNGIGKSLLNTAENHLTEAKVKFLMVKTLGESHPDKNYKETRKFYKKVGFYPLEEIKEIWGKENPCLIMVKSLVK